MTHDEIKAALASGATQRAALIATYYKLCDARDAVYAEAAPIEAQLAAASAKVIAAQAEEAKLAREVEAAWGPEWLALKKEIASLAKALGKIPARK